MTTAANPSQRNTHQLLDYSRVVGSFLILSPKGQLFALNQLLVSPDFSKLVSQTSTVDFHVLLPLLSSLTPSKILLVAHPSDRANACFLMEVWAGKVKRSVKVFQEPAEIVADALANNLFPIIHLGELQKRAIMSRANCAPLSLRISYLHLRSNLPITWREIIQQLFQVNAEAEGDKAVALEEKLQALRLAIQTQMVDEYLSKCVWLDAKTNSLRRLARTRHGPLRLTMEEDSNIWGFGLNLTKNSDGRYDAREGFAKVVSALDLAHPWSSPTLHVYNEYFRKRHGLQEHYSLYKGLQALSSIGAPVLVHQPGSSGNAIPVHLLRPSKASDQITQLIVQDFPARDIVWAAGVA